MSNSIRVLVEITGDEVHIQELTETADGPALNTVSPFEMLGTVRQAKVPGKNGDVSAWVWESEGSRGRAATKARGIDAMLADAGYVQVSLTATIPDLLGDWLEGSA